MIDLNRFCASENDPREYLRAPWEHGEWVYATNGHVCIRVPSSQYPGHVPADKHPNAAALFAKHLDGGTGEFMRMPLISEPEECTGCDGKGRVFAVKCDHCEGEGEIVFKGLRYDCRACNDGDCNAAPFGWFAVEYETPDLKVCEYCDGRGFKRYERIEIGGIGLDHGYLWWMACLPQTRYRAAADYKSPVVFIGDGFQALVMPMNTNADRSAAA